MPVMVLANANVPGVDAGTIRPDRQAVEDGTIRTVAEAGESPASGDVSDLRGVTLMPGLIDGPRLLSCGKALSQAGGRGDMRGPGVGAHDAARWQPGPGIIVNGVPKVRRGAHYIEIMGGGGAASLTDRLDPDRFSEEGLPQSWRVGLGAIKGIPLDDVAVLARPDKCLALTPKGGEAFKNTLS